MTVENSGNQAGGRATITIIIPTYRRQHWLAPLLTELDDQIGMLAEDDRGRIGILVVDNCPNGSSRDAVRTRLGLRYVAEAATGVANARNRGVAEATGSHILFIDDDERPAVGWLAAFLFAAERGDDAAFGPIEPQYESAPPVPLAALLDRLFSRRQPGTIDGQDISAQRAYLGAGNSLFRKATCFTGSQPFDPRFNGGGEDVWLLRHLVEEKGVVLRWCAGGLVHEIVPADRMTEVFLRRRRFRDGQLRVIVDAGAGGARGALRTAFWMAAGLAQFAGQRCLAVLGRNAKAARIRSEGGRGKVMWWHK